MDSKEMAPGDIERRSFEIITEELGGRTFPPLEELEQAMEVFCCSIKLAAAEKLLNA